MFENADLNKKSHKKGNKFSYPVIGYINKPARFKDTKQLRSQSK